MPSSARREVTNSPQITVKTVQSAGSMRRPQASFEAQPRIARLLAPKMGIDPYRQVGKCIRIRPGFPKKALHPAGGQSRPPLHPSLRREIFVQGKAGAGVHTVRQVRPTRPCAERSGGVFQGFICPAGRRCRAVPDPQGIRGMRRRRRWSQRRNRPAPAQRRSCPWQASGSRIRPSARSKRRSLHS